MASAFTKDVIRSVTHSWGRFIAIAIIAALGTGFFAGLRMTGPDMRLAGDEYYDGTYLSDARVVSTVGLDDNQIDQIRAVKGVAAVMPAYEADAISDVDGIQCTLRYHSLDVDAARACEYDGVNTTSKDDDYLNRPILTSGTWPKAADECLLSADTVWQSDVKIGDKVRLIEGTQDLGDTFSVREFTIVGFCKSGYYTCLTSMGSTSLGSGKLTSFAYVPDDAFADDYPYTEAFISVEGARDERWASDAYQQKVDAVTARIDAISNDIKTSRLDDLRAEAQAELDEKRAEYERKKADAEARLASGQSELDSAKAQLDSAAADLESARARMAQSEAQLRDGKARYEAGTAEVEAQKRQAYAALAQAQAQIDNAQAQYDAAMASRAQLAEQLDTAQTSLDQVQDGLAQVDAGITQATAGIDTLTATIDQLQQQIDALPADDPARATLEQQKASYEQQLAQAQEELAGLQQQKQTLEGQKTQLEGAISQLKGGIAQIDSQTAGVAESLNAARSELAAQKAAAENGFATAQQSLDAALSQLQSGAGQLESGKAQLAEGQAQYDEGFAQWQAGSSELAQKRVDAQSQFADAGAQLEEAQAKVDEIATMDADVYTLDLKKNMGVESYRSDAGRIDQIAQVFPLLFFLVAALVSLTTMTRMVDEDRMLIGTYKALGYSNARITGKYLGYAAIASGVGSIVGILALSTFLPWFIMEAYAIIYAVPCRPVPIDAPIALSSAGLGIGITVLATWFAVAATLREKPSTLMLPRAPKAGKRILLERIRPVWSRLTFSWKVTARNLFRYKRRFCMAIIGIAGCTALLLTGLGLENSINDIIDKQFGELYHYNTIVRMDEDVTAAQKKTATERIDEDSAGSSTWLATENMVVRQAGARDNDSDQMVELDVPQKVKSYSEFHTLRDRVSGKTMALDNTGALISEKLATELGVQAGDSVDIYAQDAIGNPTGKAYRVRVAGVVENYVAHYVIMTPALYEKTFGEEASFTTLYASVKEDEATRDKVSDDLLATDGVKTVSYNDETINSYRSMLKSVDSVVVVLVVAAATLAFVVLYNLTNINIAERVREIATLKVLGFTQHEVNAYIYRETLLLALIGSLVGLVLGIFMEGYVIVTAEVDQVMFGRDIHLPSFIVAFALTMVFSVIVTLFMRSKLRRIDMVESLKSVE